MQCIVYWEPQRPGSGEAPNHLAPALSPTIGVFCICLCTGSFGLFKLQKRSTNAVDQQPNAA